MERNAWAAVDVDCQQPADAPRSAARNAASQRVARPHYLGDHPRHIGALASDAVRLSAAKNAGSSAAAEAQDTAAVPRCDSLLLLRCGAGEEPILVQPLYLCGKLHQRLELHDVSRKNGESLVSS